MGPGLPSVDFEEEVITVWPDGIDAPSQVVLTGHGQGVQQVAGPAALVPLRHDNAVPRPGQVPVGGGHERVEVGHEPFAGGDEHLPGVGQSLVPDIERRGDLRPGPTPGLPEQRGG